MTTHGQTGTKLYKIWRSMIARCTKTNSGSYKYYGAKGISVCSDWAHSFEAFSRDMPGFSVGLTIDRIDPTRNYEPSNCQWATPKQQARRLSSIRPVEFNGRAMCLSEAAELVGLPYSCVSQRVRKLGWSIDKALTTPMRGAHA